VFLAAPRSVCTSRPAGQCCQTARPAGRTPGHDRTPVLQELMSEREVETMHKTLLRFLPPRFGTIPEDLEAAVQVIQQTRRFEELIDWAAQCAALNASRGRVGKP